MVREGFLRKAKPMTSLTFGRSIKIATLVPGFGSKTVRKRRVRLNSGKDFSDVPMQIMATRGRSRNVSEKLKKAKNKCRTRPGNRLLIQRVHGLPRTGRAPFRGGGIRG